MSDNLITRAEEEISVHSSLAVRGRWKEAYYALIARVKELEKKVTNLHSVADSYLKNSNVQFHRAEKAEAALALRVEVKPLEWKQVDDNVWIANGAEVPQYEVSYENRRYWTPASDEAGQEFPSLAQAAAQADYEARIRSALVVTPEKDREP